jgi:hypothetical protein
VWNKIGKSIAVPAERCGRFTRCRSAFYAWGPVNIHREEAYLFIEAEIASLPRRFLNCEFLARIPDWQRHLGKSQDRQKNMKERQEA